MNNFFKELEAKRRFKRQQRELMGEPAEEHPPALTGDMVIGKVGFEGVTWSPRPDCPYEYKGPNPLPLKTINEEEEMSMDVSNQPAPQDLGAPQVQRTESQEEIQEHYRMLGIPMGQRNSGQGARIDMNGSSGTDGTGSSGQLQKLVGSEDPFATMGDFFENFGALTSFVGGQNMGPVDRGTPMDIDFGAAPGRGNLSNSGPVRGAPGPQQLAPARKPAPLNLGVSMRQDLGPSGPRSSGRGTPTGPTSYAHFQRQAAPTPPIHTPASMDIGRPMSTMSASSSTRRTATPVRDQIQPSGQAMGALLAAPISSISGPGAGPSEGPDLYRGHNMILQLERGYREQLEKKDLEIGILRTSNNFLHKALKEKNDHCAQFHTYMTTSSTPGTSGTSSPNVSGKPTMPFENALAIFQEWMKNTKPQIERNMGIDFKKYVFDPYGSQDVPQSVLVVSTGAHLYRQANEFEALPDEQKNKWNTCAQLLTKYQWELSGLGLIQPMTVEQKAQKDAEKRMGRKRGGDSGEMMGGN
ncbi:unnamed protein product [Caenorhabditis nigoni]